MFRPMNQFMRPEMQFMHPPPVMHQVPVSSKLDAGESLTISVLEESLICYSSMG